jgi:hypothetical protein
MRRKEVLHEQHKTDNKRNNNKHIIFQLNNEMRKTALNLLSGNAGQERGFEISLLKSGATLNSERKQRQIWKHHAQFASQILLCEVPFHLEWKTKLKQFALPKLEESQNAKCGDELCHSPQLINLTTSPTRLLKNLQASRIRSRSTARPSGTRGSQRQICRI